MAGSGIGARAPNGHDTDCRWHKGARHTPSRWPHTLMVALSLATALLGEGFGRWIAAALAAAIGAMPLVITMRGLPDRAGGEADGGSGRSSDCDGCRRALMRRWSKKARQPAADDWKRRCNSRRVPISSGPLQRTRPITALLSSPQLCFDGGLLHRISVARSR